MDIYVVFDKKKHKLSHQLIIEPTYLSSCKASTHSFKLNPTMFFKYMYLLPQMKLSFSISFVYGPIGDARNTQKAKITKWKKNCPNWNSNPQPWDYEADAIFRAPQDLTDKECLKVKLYLSYICNFNKCRCFLTVKKKQYTTKHTLLICLINPYIQQV